MNKMSVVLQTFFLLTFKKKILVSFKMSLKFVSIGLFDDKPILVHIMAWYLQAASHYLGQYCGQFQGPSLT